VGGFGEGEVKEEAAAAAEEEAHEEEEEDIIFDGGLRLPAHTYTGLLAHQKTCIKWLWELHCQRAGGIVGDEMGLGKTVQVAAFLCALERSGLYTPALVNPTP
jgi:DNA excision repair protein ERCC-6